MRPRLARVLALAAAVAAGGGWNPAVLAVDDGILLQVTPGPAAGSVHLSWGGGPPNYIIYRAATPQSLASPGNQIGFTGFATFDDAPPGGFIFYYEVGSFCAPSPVEVCDGLDNECDGSVDEPGSEASCVLPNATPQCVAGECAIASCNGGFGDCDVNPDNGCEAPLQVAQSTSPDVHGGPGDPDLRPGYLRVASIANCGACGESCDDGLPCTTDLCVPSARGAAQCSHYDRAQCGGARCNQPTLPPGTPPPAEPVCAGADADADGLSNAWEAGQTNPYTGETQQTGIDLDCDGVISDAGGDLIWHEPPAGEATRDIYLQIDYMAPGPDEPLSHAPPLGVVSDVVSAFATAGITLHVDPNQHALPHAPMVYMPVVPVPVDECAAVPGSVSLYDTLYKGNPGVFDPRRSLGYRYLLFGHDTSCEAGQHTSGMAEVHGNDSIVSLADFPLLGPTTGVTRHRELVGTIMHEMGHNAGLCHEGPCSPGDPNNVDQVNQAPNSVSVMNYNYQLGGIHRSAAPGDIHVPDPNQPRRFDYVHVPRISLDEMFLDEFTGLDVTVEPFNRDIIRYFCPEKSPGPGQAPAMGPIDWNCDRVLESPVVEDVNADGELTILPGGPGEWDNLFLAFQCLPTLQDGPQDSAWIARAELTTEQAGSQGLRAGPLPCEPGLNDCDGDDFNGCETVGSCAPGPTCPADSLWLTTLSGGANASAPANDTAFNPTGESIGYLSQGNSVHAIYNVAVSGHPAGSIKWSRSLPASVNFPAPVPLEDGTESVFVTAADGFLRRLDAASGLDLFPPFDTRRSACFFDQIFATPAVQLRNLSNPVFQTAQGDDLVFVITRTMCGDSTSNRILAVRAATGTLAWTFDPALIGLTMNAGTEGCTVDYDKNLLYCMSENTGTQHSIWAINTVNGARIWSKNAGSILNRPMLRGSRVYAVTAAVGLRAYDAATGALIWTHPVAQAGIVGDLALASGGPFDGLILLTDTGGFLHAILESGNTAVTLWPPTNVGGTIVTAPAVAPGLGRAWVGRSDGRIVQVDLASGQYEADATGGPGTVFGLSLDFEGPPGTEVNRLMSSGGDPLGSRIRRFCIPWAWGSSGTS